MAICAMSGGSRMWSGAVRRAAGVSILLALGPAVPVAAQTAASYRLAAGDTLRYHVLSDGKNEVKGAGPQGTSSMEYARDWTLALTAASGDTARAWFEAFSATTSGPGRGAAAPTQGLLNMPFPLQFLANGSVHPVPGAPSLPGERGFEYRGLVASLFFRLPDRPLAPGTEWADTSGGAREGPDGPRAGMQYIRRFKVLGDTTAAGGRALVIAVKGEGTNKTTRSDRDGTNVETRMRTSETGRVVFSTVLGRLISSESTVENTRSTTVRGGTDARSGMSGPRNPTGRVEVGVGPRQGTEMRGRSHTLVEMVNPQTKASPTGK